MQQKNEAVEKLKSLVDDIKIGMLITVNTHTALKARPMATADIDYEGNLWFFTNEYSDKIKEVSFNNDVMVNYASPSANSYITINGRASLVNDSEKIKELWSPANKAWFPKGVDDPNLVLLKVVPTFIEYWDGSSSKIVVAVQLLKALVTGSEFKGGEHSNLEV